MYGAFANPGTIALAIIVPLIIVLICIIAYCEKSEENKRCANPGKRLIAPNPIFGPVSWEDKLLTNKRSLSYNKLTLIRSLTEVRCWLGELQVRGLSESPGDRRMLVAARSKISEVLDAMCDNQSLDHPTERTGG